MTHQIPDEETTTPAVPTSAPLLRDPPAPPGDDTAELVDGLEDRAMTDAPDEVVRADARSLPEEAD